MTAVVPAPRARRRRHHGSNLSGREALLLVVPALLPVFLLSAIPLARGVYLGFTDSQAGLGIATHFTGLSNFRKLLHDDLFIQSFKIGLIWAVTVTALQFVLAMGLALLLSSPIRGRAGWRARSRWCRGRCRRSSSASCGRSSTSRRRGC